MAIGLFSPISIHSPKALHCNSPSKTPEAGYYTNHAGRISALEPLRGRSGWLSASALTIEALETSEDHILLSRDDGAPLSRDAAMRLLTLSADGGDSVETPAPLADYLDTRLLARFNQFETI